jgi:hypothetical protein
MLIRALKSKRPGLETTAEKRLAITNVNYAFSRVGKTRLQQLLNYLSTATITESSIIGKYFQYLVAYALAVYKECRYSVLPS